MAVTSLTDGVAAPTHPLVPSRHRVVERSLEASDISTLTLEPIDRPISAFRAGQFNMLSAFGVGEVAISISSAPGSSDKLEHTIRDVGAVSHALWACQPGEIVGVRGPFGTDWGIDQFENKELVVIAGGIGLAPLRGAIRQLAIRPPGSSRVVVLAGARTPDQIIFGNELEGWRAAGIDVETTVDAADSDWKGHVGVVTQLLKEVPFDPPLTTALICGPEIMMRFTARALIDRGVDPSAIFVSLERNMQCGIGWCGHCQLEPYLLCRDGPVLPWEPITAALIEERER